MCKSFLYTPKRYQFCFHLLTWVWVHIKYNLLCDTTLLKIKDSQIIIYDFSVNLARSKHILVCIRLLPVRHADKVYIPKEDHWGKLFHYFVFKQWALQCYFNVTIYSKIPIYHILGAAKKSGIVVNRRFWFKGQKIVLNGCSIRHKIYR